MSNALNADNSLSRQLFKSIFGLYCLIAISVTAIQIIQEYRYTQITISEELKNYEQIFGPVLAKALWNLDREQVNDITRGFTEVPIIVAVKIEHIKNNQLVPYANRNSDNSSTENNKQFSYTFPINYHIGSAIHPLGQATLYSDSSIVMARVKLGFIFLILNALIKGIFLWFIFWWVSKKLLITPLNKLIEAISNLKFNNLSSFNIDLNIKNKNELSAIEQSFSDMVSELARAEKGVSDFNARLEQEVHKRTLELEQAKNEAEALTHAAESATQAKTTFLANVSHELRTPMNGIQGMLHLIESSELDEKQKQYTEVASASADRLLTLIDEIIDLSKAESGKFTIEETVFDIHPIFDDLAHSYNLLELKDKPIELRLNANNIQNLQAVGDPTRLRQILINLISNAIKFTEKGHIIISTLINNDVDSNNNHFYLTVSIQDTGIGIDEDNLEYIFDSFSQGDSSITRKYGGSGLGLSICKQLCELMGGSITVSSQLEEGSCFQFTIRLGKVGVD